MSKRKLGALSNTVHANADNIYMEPGSAKKAVNAGQVTGVKVSESAKPSTKAAKGSDKPVEVSKNQEIDPAELAKAGERVRGLYDSGRSTVQRAMSLFGPITQTFLPEKKAPVNRQGSVRPKRGFKLDEVINTKSGSTITHVAIHLSESKEKAAIFAYDPTVTHNDQGEKCNGEIVVITRDEKGYKVRGSCIIPKEVPPANFKIDVGKDNPVEKILGVRSIFPKFEKVVNGALLGPIDYFDSAIEYAKVKSDEVEEVLDPNGHDPYVVRIKHKGEVYNISKVSIDFTEPNHAANDYQVRPVVYLYDETVTEDELGRSCNGMVIGFERKSGSYLGGSKYYVPYGTEINDFEIKYSNHDPLMYATSVDSYIGLYNQVEQPEGMSATAYFDSLIEKRDPDNKGEKPGDSKLLAPKITL